MSRIDIMIRTSAIIIMIVGTILIAKFCKSLIVGIILYMLLFLLHGSAWVVTMTDEELWD